MNALFRCDAADTIGFGHLSRCIALAEALRLSGVTSIFAGQFNEAAQEHITAAGFEFANLGQPVNTDTADQEHPAITGSQSAAFVVIDSYRVDHHYLASLKSLGQATVVIDDFCALEEYPCDVVLNFTWEASSFAYPEGPTKLLGPAYLPARRRLVDMRARSIERDRGGPIGNLLIAIGGADPKNIAARLVQILQKHHSHLCIHTIAQADAPLAGMLGNFAPGSAIVPRQPDLSQQLLWADAIITGGGLIKYESAFMGVPAATIAQNEGQDSETKVLSKAGLVFDLGPADGVTDEELASALDIFIAGFDLRHAMGSRMRETFVADPTAHAANAILEALRR